MKTTLILSLIAGSLSTSSFAQGTVTFSAPRGSLRYSVDGITEFPVPAGSPAALPAFGRFNLALYAAPQGATISTLLGFPDLSGWTLVTPVLSAVAPFDGTMPATVVTIPPALSGSAGGNTVQLEVVAWTGSYTTFQEAVVGFSLLAWSGDPKSGGALGWSQPTGTANPPSTVFVRSGENAFNGLVLSVPEPSTLAIAALGAALLLLHRRTTR